ncbi:MAG: hypothetical protein PHZ00_03855 [Candidatus Peribacteraceae bacterium]|nr:hypothetical protein [Candidatus Peribacteraceae bacterium]
MDTNTKSACTHASMKNCPSCGKPMCDDCGLSCTCEHVKVDKFECTTDGK